MLAVGRLGELANNMRCSHCGVENPAGMRFCGGCGRPLESGAAPAARAEAPQRRHMTVMFCDLVDSTPLAQALDAEDFREVLTDYRQACLRAVERFGGFTAVYSGDGMTVYFGYPRAHEDDAQRAVHTGLAILDQIAELNMRLEKLYGISVQVRIGVHSGIVIAEELGGGGSETASQLDVSGEMPHIAARIESTAPHNSVAVSDATLELVEGYFESEPLGQKMLKGIAEPIGVHRIVRATGALGRLEVAAGRRLTPVVGREAELRRLKGAWEQAAAGRGGVVHVTGEAGIGKSRLVHELVESLGGEAGDVQRWQCSAHHQSSSLYPVATFVERALGVERGEDPKAALQCAAVGAGLDAAETVPLLADLLSIRLTESAHNLTPRDARTALLHVLEQMLVTNSQRHPLLLVVEDLHWADPTTIELLGRVVRGLVGCPVLSIFTFRPGFQPPWRASELPLAALNADEVRAMALAATETEPDPAVLEWVETAADGVPLFVEEMLKSGEARATSAVPPTLEGLLTERLDRLPELADVIDMAAILGREFDGALLSRLAPLRGADLDHALVQLTAQDVRRGVEGVASRYEFSHGLLQEAAYARILRRRRRALHGRVAETLVHDFPDTVEREPELVAHHWSAADEPAQAVSYWHAAGIHALERAAYVEAAEHFRRGLDALDASAPNAADDLHHVDFLTHIGASLQAARGYAANGVDDAYSRARAACERVCNDTRLVPIIRGEWMFHLLRGEYATALALADEMLALAQRGAAPAAEGHVDRGLVHMYLGEFDLAREHLESAVERYERTEQPDHIYEAQGDTGVGALAYGAVVLWNLGRADEAGQRSDVSLERAELAGGAVTRAQAWGMRAILHLNRGEGEQMARWVQKTYAHSADHDLGYWRTASALLAAWIRGRAGEIETGTREFRANLDKYVGSGSRLGLPHFHILYADLRRAAGDFDDALALLRAGEEFIEETGERFSESELFRFKGRLLMSGDRPDPDAATAAFERAVATARAQNARLLELQAATRLADHQVKLGEDAPVLDRVSELCEWFGPESQLADVVRARSLLAETMAR
jgi:class 3 adenylate cyclase/predicted ATPase